MPPNDPRFLNISTFQMEDEFRTHMSYTRLARGETDETEYDSGESEEDILRAADLLAGGPPEGAPLPAQWDDVSPEDLLKELDQL